MGEVVVDLASHPLDLLRDVRRLLRLLQQERERRLQSVREIARLRHRARDLLLPIREQRVQLIDERLHLGRIVAGDAPFAAVAHGGEALAQSIERLHTAAQLQQADRREHGADREHVVMIDAPQRGDAHDDDHRCEMRQREEAERPEDRAEEELHAERAGHHASPPMR